MELMVDLGSWVFFLKTRLAEAEVAYDAAKEALGIAEAEALVDAWGGSRDDRVTVAKAERTLDRDVRDAKDELHARYARRKYLAAIFDGVTENRFTVSRELTRRVGGADIERRTDRWTT